MINGATFAIYEGSSCTGTPLGTFTTQNQSYPSYFAGAGNSGGGGDGGRSAYNYNKNNTLAYNNSNDNIRST